MGCYYALGNIPAVSVAYNLNILNCNRHTIEHNTLTVTVASACKICFCLVAYTVLRTNRVMISTNCPLAFGYFLPRY